MNFCLKRKGAGIQIPKRGILASGAECNRYYGSLIDGLIVKPPNLHSKGFPPQTQPKLSEEKRTTKLSEEKDK